MQPDYVAFDHKQREEYLSQLGNFSPGERELFHRLCQNWQERIPYGRFATVIARSDGGTVAELISLLDKLRRRGIGLMRTAVSNGERNRDAIVLCPLRSPAFFAELIDEFFVDNQESINAPLPLYSYLRESYGEIPATVFTLVTADDLAQVFAAGEPDGRVLALATVDDDMVVVRASNLRALLTVAIQKLRFYLNNTTLLGFFAKATDMSLINLKQQCAGKDAGFWLKLTETVAGKRSELATLRAVQVDVEFHHAAAIVHTLISAQMAAAAARRKADEERELDLEAIAMGVHDAPEGWVEQAQLARMLESQREKYGGQFEQFKKEFYERFVTQRARSTLPLVVRLDRRYLHRDNVVPLFLEHFRSVSNDLKDEFVAQMELQLRGRNRRANTTFYSLDNLDEAIREQVHQRSDYLSALIDRPSVLAEAMIAHAKKHKLAKDVGELKRQLSAYFDPDTMKPLPLHIWFNLRPVELFELAFERLSVWRRIITRLSGKYESFRSRFIAQTARGSVVRGEGTQTEPRSDASRRDGRSRAAGDRRGSRSDTHSSPARRRRAQVERKQSYTKQQVDSAWEEFSTTLRKKN